MNTQTLTAPRLLWQLGIPAHRIGYRALTLALPRYAEHPTQSFTKELYPCVSSRIPGTTSSTVEAAIRRCITDAWVHRDPDLWDALFPHHTKAPSNAVFIATLAEFLKASDAQTL